MPRTKREHGIFEVFKLATEHHTSDDVRGVLRALLPDADTDKVIDSLGRWHPGDGENEEPGGSETAPEETSQSFSDHLRAEIRQRSESRAGLLPKS
jgi:hypothetical protein